MPVKQKCKSSARSAGRRPWLFHARVECQQFFKLAKVEGLAEMMIEELEIGLEGFFIVIVACGRYDHEPFKVRQLAHLLCYLAAVEAGHLEIQKYHMRPERLHNSQGFPPAVGNEYLMAPQPEQDLQALARIGVIVGNEDTQSPS